MNGTNFFSRGQGFGKRHVMEYVITPGINFSMIEVWKFLTSLESRKTIRISEIPEPSHKPLFTLTTKELDNVSVIGSISTSPIKFQSVLQASCVEHCSYSVARELQKTTLRTSLMSPLAVSPPAAYSESVIQI